MQSYQEIPELICADEHCGELFETTTSALKYTCCSLECEMELAEREGQCVVKVSGRFPRIARIEGEKFTFPQNPSTLIHVDHKRTDADIFTFLQHPRLDGIRYNSMFHVELDNLAIVPISTFDQWWTKQIDAKTRNEARQAEKKNAEVMEVCFDAEYARGISDIYCETPIRQGKKFHQYGMTPDQAIPYANTFLERSIFLGAYYEGKMIAFLKMVMDSKTNPSYACILHILGSVEHRDKSPTNALIAQAVKSCAERGISQLAYYNFSYGKKEEDGLAKFKRNNGFEKVDVPRYYFLKTVRGVAAYKLGLHRRLTEMIPEAVAAPLRKIRASISKK